MTTKVKGTEGVEFPDATVQASAAYLPTAFAAKRSSTQSFPQQAWTVLIPETELLDTNNAYNPTTGIYTVPVAGWYQVDWHVEFVAGTNTSAAPGVFSNVLQNETPVLAGGSTAIGGKGCVTCGSGLIQCVIGDQLKVRGYQENSASAAVNATGRFSAHLVRKT